MSIGGDCALLVDCYTEQNNASTNVMFIACSHVDRLVCFLCIRNIKHASATTLYLTSTAVRHMPPQNHSRSGCCQGCAAVVPFWGVGVLESRGGEVPVPVFQDREVSI